MNLARQLDFERRDFDRDQGSFHTDCKFQDSLEGSYALMELVSDIVMERPHEYR